MGRPALTTTNLALINLRQRPFRTLSLSGTVALFAFALFGGSLLAEGIRLGIASMASRLGCDILLVPHGYEKTAQAVLLRGEPSTIHLKGDLTDKVREIPGVDKASPQLYLATLNAACCSWPVQMIAYEPQTDFVVGAWMQQVLGAPQKPDEVVVGDKIIGVPGTRISLFKQEFGIAARLDRTGMGFDTSIFITMPRARQMLRESETARELEKTLGPNPVSSIMILVEPGADIRTVANAILQKYAVEYNLDVMVTKNLVKDIADRLHGMGTALFVVTGILWVSALLVMTMFFSAMLGERKREFALLRIMGAAKRKLSGLVLMEAAIISFLGAAIGISLAALLFFPFHTLVGTSIGLPYLAIPGRTIAWLVVAAFVPAAAVGPIACAWTAWRLGVSDTHTTLREGE